VSTATLTEKKVREPSAGAWMVIGIFFAVLLFAAYVEYGRLTRPTVPRVAEMANVGFDDQPAAALERTVDGLGFPRWARSGFTAIGGSTFTVSGRPAATVVYARDLQRITYTIVSGSGHINYATGTITRYRRVGGEMVELNWLASPGGVLTFKRNSRTVVMTGTPATAGLARTMSRLATQR
jgi:anti-sigma factor RsiW